MMWLRDLLPKDIEDNGYSVRILTYGYDTTLNGSHSYAGVDDHTTQFLEAVKGARGRVRKTSALGADPHTHMKSTLLSH